MYTSTGTCGNFYFFGNTPQGKGYADKKKSADYTPYGTLLHHRHGQESTTDYRYGFQGQEADDEVSGEGNSYTAEFWQYSPRIGKRFNIDPVVKSYESPYACFANNPIWFADPFGADTFNINVTTWSYQGDDMPGDRGSIPMSSQTSSIDIKAGEGQDVFYYNSTLYQYNSEGELISANTQSYELNPFTNPKQGVFSEKYFFGLFTYRYDDQQSLAKLLPDPLLDYLIEKNSGWDQIAFKSIEGYKKSYALIGALKILEEFIYTYYIGGSILTAMGTPASAFLTVETSSGAAPMQIVRSVGKGEKIDDIVNFCKAETFTTGNEHALVKLANGERAIVSGNSNGISFAENQIRSIFGHTHPTGAPPSAADFRALEILNQSQQTVYHGGLVTKIRKP